ncbi:MAG: cell division protein FtsL [Treponema sp.]|nr:cell division protein FtsL [Treponema sp.]
MIRHRFLLYFFVLTIPLFLGLTAWQSVRYSELDRNTRRLEAAQERWIESNNRLIAGIAVLSSSSRIEQVAIRDLGLTKMPPENVLQIRIDGGGER